MKSKTLMTLVGTVEHSGNNFRYHLRDNISKKGLEGLMRKTRSVDIETIVFPDGREIAPQYYFELFSIMQHTLTPSPEREEFFKAALREAEDDMNAWKALEKAGRNIEAKSPEEFHPGDCTILKILGKLQ